MHVLPTNQTLTINHSFKGIKELIKLFQEIQPQQIVLEATGGLERELVINIPQTGLKLCASIPDEPAISQKVSDNSQKPTPLMHECSQRLHNSNASRQDPFH